MILFELSSKLEGLVFMQLTHNELYVSIIQKNDNKKIKFGTLEL